MLLLTTAALSHLASRGAGTRLRHAATGQRSVTQFKVGHVYQRQKIHDLFGRERQKGISRPVGQPATTPFSCLLTMEARFFGVGDGWIDEQTFQYLGEGSKGDMTFTSGNLAIRDHVQFGKTLLLFAKVAPKMVRFEGEMIFTGYELIPNVPDAAGQPRTVIAMRLKRRSSTAEIQSRNKGQEGRARSALPEPQPPS